MFVYSEQPVGHVPVDTGRSVAVSDVWFLSQDLIKMNESSAESVYTPDLSADVCVL